MLRTNLPRRQNRATQRTNQSAQIARPRIRAAKLMPIARERPPRDVRHLVLQHRHREIRHLCSANRALVGFGLVHRRPRGNGSDVLLHARLVCRGAHSRLAVGLDPTLLSCGTPRSANFQAGSSSSTRSQSGRAATHHLVARAEPRAPPAFPACSLAALVRDLGAAGPHLLC